MNNARKNLGSELVAMPYAKRIDLMRALVFRRLDQGIKLTRPQLELGLKYDDEEIQKYWKGWKVEDFIHVPLFEFFAEHLVKPGYVKETPVEGKKYSAVEQTPAGADWVKALDEDFAFFVECFPMSTRGLFDNYRDEPEVQHNMTQDELMATMAADPTKHIGGFYDPKQLLKGQGFKAPKDEDEDPDEV
jgi:hypothetical protein